MEVCAGFAEGFEKRKQIFIYFSSFCLIFV